MTRSAEFPDDLSVDGVYDVLSHPVRRALIDSLEGTETTTVGKVAADLIEADERRVRGIESGGGTEQVEAELHHIHLPKMADVGLIEYDPDTGTIEITPTTDVADRIMETVSGGHGDRD